MNDEMQDAGALKALRAMEDRLTLLRTTASIREATAAWAGQTATIVEPESEQGFQEGWDAGMRAFGLALNAVRDPILRRK